jgi:hypothetical protein
VKTNENFNTGIHDKCPKGSEQIDISVFPNPATDMITFKAGADLSGTAYLITDQSGRQVLTGKKDSETVLINISQFQNGIYYIMVADQKRRSLKVIKN